MKTLFIWIVGCLALVSGIRSIQAQPLVYGTLIPLEPATGEITSEQPQNWSFQAVEGQVLSFSLRGTSSDIDPTMSLLNSSGTVIIANDDYAYPETTDALLEAVTIPRSDTYTLAVSSVGATTGSYELWMYPGFGTVLDRDAFEQASGWESATPNSALDVDAVDGQMQLSISGPDAFGIASSETREQAADYFASIDVAISEGVNGWIVGMTARQQSAANTYLLQVNDEGQYRFLLLAAGGTTTLRDWTSHPAIAIGASQFSLQMMALDSGFEFFFNNSYFGRVVDSTIQNAGTLGLSVAATSSLTSETVAQFDNLVVSEPLRIDGARILPQQLILSTPNNMSRDLHRQGLIPAQGEVALNVSESFVESQRPGVEEVMLGRGTTYQRLAVATTLSWQPSSDGISGCGLLLRSTSDTDYVLAYADQNAGYGLSQRLGETFLPGIFGESAAQPEQTSGHLLVIANGAQLLYFVNGIYRGQLADPGAEGGIGNAVVNFDPVRTSCQFRDTWVWSWTE
jgi:hypothetical protein